MFVRVLGDFTDFDSRVIWMSELKRGLSQRKIMALRYCRQDAEWLHGLVS